MPGDDGYLFDHIKSLKNIFYAIDKFRILNNKFTYQSIVRKSVGEYTEKSSRFMACAFPIESLNQIQDILKNIKKDHPKAKHHCYGCRLGLSELVYKVYDDGEPSGTAGKPILVQIDQFQLTDILVVVTRYFGGILLGSGGLSRAYKSAAKAALEQADIAKKERILKFKIHSTYQNIQIILGILKQHGLEILSVDTSEDSCIVFVVPISEKEDIFLKLKSKIEHLPIREITMDTLIIKSCEISEFE